MRDDFDPAEFDAGPGDGHGDLDAAATRELVTTLTRNVAVLSNQTALLERRMIETAGRTDKMLVDTAGRTDRVLGESAGAVGKAISSFNDTAQRLFALMHQRDELGSRALADFTASRNTLTTTIATTVDREIGQSVTSLSNALGVATREFHAMARVVADQRRADYIQVFVWVAVALGASVLIFGITTGIRNLFTTPHTVEKPYFCPGPPYGHCYSSLPGLVDYTDGPAPVSSPPAQPQAQHRHRRHS